MDIEPAVEKEFTALGGLFQHIITDLKVIYYLYMLLSFCVCVMLMSFDSSIVNNVFFKFIHLF